MGQVPRSSSLRVLRLSSDVWQLRCPGRRGPLCRTREGGALRRSARLHSPCGVPHSSRDSAAAGDGGVYYCRCEVPPVASASAGAAVVEATSASKKERYWVICVK